MSEELKDGKMDLMGINIDISQVLGEKIVDQYLAQINEADMRKIFDYISSDLWKNTKVYDEKTGSMQDTLIVKTRTKNQWGEYKEKEIPIGELIKNNFNNRIKEELKNKVEEIIASADYQDKIEEIANDLVDYSINGYKEDMKQRIRERLVGNVMDEIPNYDGISLWTIINQAIDLRFSR